MADRCFHGMLSAEAMSVALLGPYELALLALYSHSWGYKTEPELGRARPEPSDSGRPRARLRVWTICVRVEVRVRHPGPHRLR